MKADLSMAQSPYGPGEGQPESAQGRSGQQVSGSSGASYFRVIPTISVSERYDSNILLLRAGGAQKSDYITDIRPGARVTYSGEIGDGTLTGNAISSIYVNNPGLNYIGGQLGFNATLDKVSERVIRGFGLRASGSVLYYPEQPGFITPQSLESVTNFTRGIQARRNNAINNTSTLEGAYAVNPLVQITSSYTFQTMRFLGQSNYSDSGGTLPLFNTIIHGMSVGPRYHFLPNHTIGASYTYRQVAVESSASTVTTGGRSFSIHGAGATLSSALSPEWRAEISPGVSLASQVPDRLLWTINASLQWLGQQKSATLSFNRGFYPSYYGEAALLVSNVVNASFSYKLTDKWSVALGANYALNTRAGRSGLRFESIGANGTVRYALSERIFAAVTGSHGDFTIEQAGSEFKYDRQVGMFTLSAEWD